MIRFLQQQGNNLSKEDMQMMINQMAQQFSSMSNPPPVVSEPDLRTPQNRPLQGQQQNAAGGFSYKVDDLTYLKRYLVMGKSIKSIITLFIIFHLALSQTNVLFY